MSLLDHISEDSNSIINSFKMSMSHPSYEKIVLYLEGKSDIALFRGLVDERKIDMISVNGKKNIIKIMDSLYSNYRSKVFAVCDADFDNIFQKKEERLLKGIFITDYHDIEMIMFYSSAMKKIINQNANNNSFGFYKNFEKQIISVCRKIGILRFASQKHNLNLRFKKLNFNNFLNFINNEIYLDTNVLISDIIKLTPNANTNEEQLKNLYECYEIKEYDEKQICCGHDCSNIIAIYFNYSDNIIGKNFNKEKIEQYLMLAFNQYEEFDIFNNVKGLA